MFENQLSLFGENVKFINKEEDKSREKQQAKKGVDQVDHSSSR